MKKIWFATIVLFLLISCVDSNADKVPLVGIWRLSAREQIQGEPESRDPLMDEAKAHEAGQEGMLLSIFPDQSYTLLNEAGFYEEGTWEWKDEGERIRLSSGKKQRDYEVTLTAQKDEQAELVLKDKKAKHVWQRQALMLQKWKEDEFYKTNNQWRIKPSHVETKQELIARLGSYLRHTTYLLKAADTRDVDVVSFAYADGVVKIYNSGIGVKEWENISDQWKYCFYNENQAKEACILYRNYLNNYPYNGTGSSNWVKDDYFLLLHIYNDLTEGKFNKPIQVELLTKEDDK